MFLSPACRVGGWVLVESGPKNSREVRSTLRGRLLLGLEQGALTRENSPTGPDSPARLEVLSLTTRDILDGLFAALHSGDERSDVDDPFALAP